VDSNPHDVPELIDVDRLDLRNLHSLVPARELWLFVIYRGVQAVPHARKHNSLASLT
jgi:hypothetical protein